MHRGEENALTIEPLIPEGQPKMVVIVQVRRVSLEVAEAILNRIDQAKGGGKINEEIIPNIFKK